MRIRTVGAGCLVAFALVGCAKGEDPAGIAKQADVVAQRQGAGEPAAGGPAPAATAAGEPAPVVQSGESAWVARTGDLTVELVEVETYAGRGRKQGLEGLSLEQKRDLAQKLLVRKALAVEAERAGFGKDPSVARAAMEWKFRTYPALYWAETVEKEVTVGDDELRALIRPASRYLLSAIVLGDDEADGREAERIHDLLAAGGDFAKLASEFSLGFAAKMGGEIDWTVIPSKMIEAPEAAIIAATPPGAFTRPILTRLGWTIFKVRDRMEAEKIFIEEKAKRLPTLLSEKIAEAKSKRLAELRAGATISYPAEQAAPRLGAPAAIVNGYTFPADPAVGAQEQHGNVSREVTPQKEQLEKSINAFLIVLDAERLGFDGWPEHRAGLAQQRMESLAQLYLRDKGQSVVTAAEEQEEYRRYYSPDVYEIQMISVNDRARAAEALRRTRGGEDFDALAKEFNSGKLAASAGRLPLGSTAHYAPLVQAVLPTLADGGVSEVLDIGGGSFVVVKRLSKQIFEPPTFEQVAGKVRKRIELRKRSESMEAFIENYRKNLKISFNEKLLAQL